MPFSGYAEASFLTTCGGETISPVPDPVPFNEPRFNTGGHFNNVTSTYTVPFDGTYEFTVSIRSQRDTDYLFDLVVDEISVATTRNADVGGPGFLSAMISVPLQLNSGQQVWVRAPDTSAIYGRDSGTGRLLSWFSGHILNID